MKKKGDYQPTRGYVDYYCELYKQGKSSYKIAKMFGLTAGGVASTLRNRGILRKAPGRDIEDNVIRLLKTMGYTTSQQKGNCVFDAYVDGKKVNIKSAKKTEYQGKNRFVFDLAHKDSLKINYKNEYEELYLVFFDGVTNPIYRLNTSILEAKKTLTIVDYRKCKYPLTFITNYKEIIL